MSFPAKPVEVKLLKLIVSYRCISLMVNVPIYLATRKPYVFFTRRFSHLLYYFMYMLYLQYLKNIYKFNDFRLNLFNRIFYFKCTTITAFIENEMLRYALKI